MQLTIRFETLLKRAAGVTSQSLEIAGPCDVREVVRRLADEAGDSVRPMLIDASGNVQASLLVFVNDRQIAGSESCAISEGDDLTLMSPISGG